MKTDNVIVIALILLLLLSGGTGGGGSTSPTKTIPPQPSALTVFDNSPEAKKDLDSGVAGVIDSTADGSIQMWFRKEKNGQWLKYGIKEPAPDPKLADNAWVCEAYDVWVAAGKKVPWTVASGPSGRGYSGPTPASQDEAKKLLQVTAK